MTEPNEVLIADLNKTLAIELSAAISFTELEETLAAYVNELIQKDFEKLVSLLYRVDVNENKLKGLLDLCADENAGKIIAQLIIERQQQKINSRKEFGKKDDSVDADEKW
jgi:hypothetical protein